MLKRIFTKIFPANSLDTDLRYRHVISLLKPILRPSDKLLEVGSGPAGLTRYFEKKITGLDLKFTGQVSPLLAPVKGSALKMPFPKNSFDIVISLDMLEHLSANQRGTAISEMIRVAKKYLIIAVPTGKDSEIQDQKLNTRVKDPILLEHLNNGLPQDQEILKMLKQSAADQKKKISIDIYSNTNLKLRQIFMSWYYSSGLKHKMFWALLPLTYFWPLFNFGKCYRKIFFVTIVPKPK